MSETTGEIKQRLAEWIHLCEQSMATGYATELMQEAINRIDYLESEKGDPMVEWMSAESLEMHIVRLKQNLREQAMRIAQLQQESAALREEKANWEETAAQYARNADYYRDLVVQIGKHFGEKARTSDDGSVQDDVLCAKVPELVAELKESRDNALRLVNNWIAWREMGCGSLGCLLYESEAALLQEGEG